MDEDHLSKNNDIPFNINEKLSTQNDFNIKRKSKTIKLNTIKSYSQRKELDKDKNKVKVDNYNLYEKFIFEPIYSQIHQNMQDFEKEIKTGKKLLKPAKKIQKQIFNYIFRAGNLLLDDGEKNSRNDKKIFRNSKVKQNIFLKTFNGNLNKFFDENSQKKVLFRNPNLNDIINNKKSEDNCLSIKSYTDKNTKNEKEESKNAINTEIQLNQKTNSNIIQRNTEPKFISTNSLLNISQINKTLTSTTYHNNNSKEKVHRRKTYYVEYDPKWYLKNKFIRTHFEEKTITNPLFQKKLIDDELILIFDNMKQFQSKYLVNKNLIKDFGQLARASKSSINSLLEETIGLFIEISYLLLDNYGIDINKYITNPISRITKKKEKKVYSEKKEFRENTAFIYECYIFLNICYDTYKIILNNKKNFCIKKDMFEILFQYLDRARFTISKVCSELYKLYQEPNKEDKKLVERCMNKIKANHIKILNEFNLFTKRTNPRNKRYDINTNSQSYSRTKLLKKFNTKYKSQIDCHQKFRISHKGIDSFSYKGPKKLKLTESQLMNIRINNAFGGNSRNLKLKHFPKFDINSPLVTSLMKYATNTFKNDIISERLRQRFYNTNNDE